MRLKKQTKIGEHIITVPNHTEIAKGTLNDILTKISMWNGIPKEDLIALMNKTPSGKFRTL